MQRITRTGLLAVAASVLWAGDVHAVPVGANAITPSNFGITIAWSAFGTATGSGVITGSASTDLTATATNVSTVGGSGSFNVSGLVGSGLMFGPIAFENFHISLTLPPTTSTNGTNPFSPDLGGSVVSVDDGQVVQLATPATLFDFSKAPIVVAAPAGSLTTLDTAAGLWTIPLTATSTLEEFNAPVNITIGAVLTLQIVPEPGTLLLLVSGLVGLAVHGVCRQRV